MKHFLLFLLPLLTIVVGGFVVFGLVQTNAQEKRLTEELTRKAKAVAESMELSAQQILINHNMIWANVMVQGFQNRERVQGCVLYDDHLKILAITDRISDWKKKGRAHLAPSYFTEKGHGSFGELGNSPVYSYVQPVMGENGSYLGYIEVLYDTSYIRTMVGEFWQKTSIYLIILSVLLVFTTLLLQRQIFFQPIRQLTRWFSLFQKGDIDTLQPIRKGGIFGQLATEAEQVALNLRIARKIVIENATERIAGTELWTREKLRDLVQAKLGENTLIVVSNREPYMHVTDAKTGLVKCIRPASGVVTAIDPILRACGGTWIAHGSTPEDRTVVNSRIRSAYRWRISGISSKESG